MDNFWDFINQHWIFSQKGKVIDSSTQMIYELCKRHNCDYEGMFLDLQTILFDYAELKE
jgi:hypothetical protein